jgi:hypothetical protein
LSDTLGDKWVAEESRSVDYESDCADSRLIGSENQAPLRPRDCEIAKGMNFHRTISDNKEDASKELAEILLVLKYRTKRPNTARNTVGCASSVTLERKTPKFGFTEPLNIATCTNFSLPNPRAFHLPAQVQKHMMIPSVLRSVKHTSGIDRPCHHKQQSSAEGNFLCSSIHAL